MEPSNVSPMIAPDPALMLQHLSLLFGRALHGLIEITGIHTDPAIRPRTRLFAVDAQPEAADYALALNAEPGRNVYVGAALRREDTPPGKAADDTCFLGQFALFADADDAEQVAKARETYTALNLKPPFVVVTGREPTLRSQLWWPLDEPIYDIDEVRGALRGIAATLGTDPKVCTGKQLMRLAGSVAWPKNKEGRVLERTEVHRPSGAQAEFSVEQIARACPPLAWPAAGSGSIPAIEVAPAGALGLGEKIVDGREEYAFRLVRAHLHELLGTTGAVPSAEELYASAWPVFFEKTDQTRGGRGAEFLFAKCGEALRAFASGQIPYARTLDEAVASYAARAGAIRQAGHFNSDEFNGVDGAAEAPPADDDAGPICAADLTGDPPERRWIVTDWIVEGAVNSLYGDGGVGKTLIAQQLAYAVSVGTPWLGLPVVGDGSVLAVLCEDEQDELHRRHAFIRKSMAVLGNPFDGVWLWPRVGRDNTLVRWDRDGKAVLPPFYERVLAEVRARRPRLLILDTLADIYGGSEIDRVQVNYFVKTVLGGLIREQEAAGSTLTVLLLGHPSVSGKADGRGFSGSTAWNNAVRSRLYLSKPEDGSSDERVLTRGKANYASSGEGTAIRLTFDDGVLRPENPAEDATLENAVSNVVSAVEACWKAGKPLMEATNHARNINKVLIPELRGRGFDKDTITAAIRQAADDGRITKSTTGVRGWRGPK